MRKVTDDTRIRNNNSIKFFELSNLCLLLPSSQSHRNIVCLLLHCCVFSLVHSVPGTRVYHHHSFHFVLPRLNARARTHTHTRAAYQKSCFSRCFRTLTPALTLTPAPLTKNRVFLQVDAVLLSKPESSEFSRRVISGFER